MKDTKRDNERDTDGEVNRRNFLKAGIAGAAVITSAAGLTAACTTAQAASDAMPGTLLQKR